MSSLFEVPQQLVLILSLAASGAAEAQRADAALHAKAAVSAAEPILFSEQVWLEALKYGASTGEAAAYSNRVFRTSGGRFYVPSEAERQPISNLRHNAKIAASVAFSFARRNAAELHTALLRKPTAGELYLAHAFGSETALALIEAAAEDALQPITRRFAGLAQIHPELRDGAGRPYSAGYVVSRMKRSVDRKPSGEAVAAWFKRGPGFALAGDLKGRVFDDARMSDSSIASAADVQ